ncbi:hypothetical protein [Streptomyces luteolus]|uniref:Uncharacterized protein n=1 Tax=Streptomyces luteolus TaxID=3043615 RepID=A0ABT6T4X7_9ACTN|nr:hypothetical protein [Streptomyces sp. B-S-A12]MDI3422690.1 hypothetical protein [Streptomyces sp. B-S-A12]
MSGTTQISDPQSLKKAGTGAGELAGRMKAIGASADTESQNAASAMKMDYWYGSLGVALEGALRTWQSQTDALVGKCRSLHDKCTQTADNYLTTETANAQGMNAIRPTLSDFD